MKPGPPFAAPPARARQRAAPAYAIWRADNDANPVYSHKQTARNWLRNASSVIPPGLRRRFKKAS